MVSLPEIGFPEISEKPWKSLIKRACGSFSELSPNFLDNRNEMR
jgi:hypothetical protein